MSRSESGTDAAGKEAPGGQSQVVFIEWEDLEFWPTGV